MAEKEKPSHSKIDFGRSVDQALEFIDSILENIPDMIFVKEAKELRFVRFNKAGERLLGYKREDLIGKNDYDFFPKEEADFFTAKDREVLAGGKVVEIAEEPIHTQSGIKWLHTKKVPILDGDGKPQYLLGISEDITQKKLAQEQVEEMQFAMANTLEGILRADEKGNIVEVNQAYASMYSLQPEELKGKNWMCQFHPEDLAKAEVAYQFMKQNGKGEEEVRASRKDGSYFTQGITLVRMQNGEGECTGHYCFGKDITEHKYQKGLEIKSDLISMVSHELRTPLHALSEGVSLVREGLTGDLNEEQSEMLGIVHQNAERLVRLVNSVLDFQKLESGVANFKIQENDLNTIIHDVERSTQILVGEKDLTIELNLDSSLPKVECDGDRVSQVVMNLLTNAIKFTRKGKVIIRTSSQENEVLTTIQDTGIGIQNEDIPKLFRNFGQLESAKILAPGGTGLGLAISKKIIEQHKGQIFIESTYGKGSVFSFSLPLRQ